MCWLKRDLWKTGIALAGMLLLLILMVWVPVSAAGAYEGASGLAIPGTVQATPTEDITVTALNKEKLQQDIAKAESDRFWAWTGSGTIIVGIVGAIFTFLQFYRSQREARDAQDKELRDRVEERFRTAVAALEDEKENAQVGGAILLRSFLNEDNKNIYRRYYTQIFDLVVAHLRLPRTPNPPEDPLLLVIPRQELGQYTELCVESESGILNWHTVHVTSHQEDTNDSHRAA